MTLHARFASATLVAAITFLASLLAQFAGATWGFFNQAVGIVMIGCGLLTLVLAGLSLISAVASSDEGPRRAFGRSAIAMAIIVLATFLYAARWVHPTENVTGSNDEGVYAVTAANLSSTGSYYLRASALPSVPSSFEPWVTKKDPPMANRTAAAPRRYPRYHTCLFIVDKDQGLLASQFPVGFPALLASIHSWFGLAGLHWINPTIAFGAAILLGWLTARWLGSIAGLAAFALALWFPLNVWAGNSLFAEPLLGALWLMVLLAFAYRDAAPIGTGLLAGLGAGLSLAVKIDSLPVAVLTAIVALTMWRKERQFCVTTLAAFVVASTVSLAGWSRFNASYVESTVRALMETNWRQGLVAVIFGLAALLLWLFRGRWPQFDVTLRQPAVQHRIMMGMAAAGFLLACYAYFVRPHAAASDHFYYWPQDREIRSFREFTFQRLGWYWTPWGLGAATIGACLLFPRISARWQLLFAGVGALFLISFCYDLRNNPIQPYAMRRLLPYATPLLLAGAASAWLAAPRFERKYAAALTAVTCTALLVGFFGINDRLNRTTEYVGWTDQLATLASAIPSDAIILTREAGPFARLATPLEFVHQRPCLLVRTSKSGWFQSSAKEAIRRWQAAGKRVLLLTSQSADALELKNVRPTLLTQGTLFTRRTIQSPEKLRTEQSGWELNYTLNELPKL